jgi:glyoxylase-like metal-dependent hydrolase (beta-lactamase superfamily II)
MGGRGWMAGTLGLALCVGACGSGERTEGSDARDAYGASGAEAARPGGWSTLDSFEEARTVVERALEALGGADAIERARGLALEGEGVLDLGTMLQGHRPFEGDPHPIREVVAWLPQDDRLVHELDAPVNPDARSWRRTDHRAGGTYHVDRNRGRASWASPGNRRSVERTIPHLLLSEVLRHPAGLRHLGRVETAGGERSAVSWSPAGSAPVTLLFDPATGLLRAAEALADLPVRGDSRIRWSFLEHENVPGLGPYPTGYAIHVDGERLQEVRWTVRTAAPEGGVLDLPPEIELPAAEPFDDVAGGPSGDDGDRDRSGEPFDIRTLSPGVHLLVNLRTGFHMLFVEFADHVVAVDAPSGWWELQELPPRNWAGIPSPALGERYVEGIRSRVGDKPIRSVVLTHHHSDHMGGVRAFVEEGATVVATELTRPVVERTLRGTLDLAGREDVGPPPLRFEAVDGTRTLRDETMEMQILDVGANPHAEGMLAVWLPGADILYVSDLFEPWGAGSSPSPERLPVMRWFVEWLDHSGLDPERIYAIHRAALVSDENVAEIRRLTEETR